MSNRNSTAKESLSAYQRWEMASFDPVPEPEPEVDDGAFEAELQRLRDTAHAQGIRILDLKLRQQMVALLIFFNLEINDRGQPLAAHGSEAINIRLSEILLGPIFFADNVAVEESRIVL